MHNDRTGIQADKPFPPWEQPGAFRKDCEPHRGIFLNLGLVLPSFLIGGFALILQGFYILSVLQGHCERDGRHKSWECFADPKYRGICGIILIVSSVGLFPGLAAWLLARRDLAKINKGVMDPRGTLAVDSARVLGMLGWAGNGFFITLNVAILIAMLLY